MHDFEQMMFNLGAKGVEEGRVKRNHRMHRKWLIIVSACLLIYLSVGVDKDLIDACGVS